LVETDNGSVIPITNLPLTRSNLQTIAQIGGYYGQQVGIHRGVVGVGTHSMNVSDRTPAFTGGDNILLNRRGGGINNSLKNYNDLKSVLVHEKYHLDRGQGCNFKKRAV